MEFKRFLLEEKQTVFTVYHGTNNEGLQGIRQQRRFHPLPGNYGTAVYTTVENNFANHASYQFVVAAAIDLKGSLIFKDTDQGKLREQVYGTRYTDEMLNSVLGNLISQDDMKGMMWGGWKNYIPFLEKHIPAIVLDGKGQSTWVVVYDAETIVPQKFANTADMRWAAIS